MSRQSKSSRLGGQGGRLAFALGLVLVVVMGAPRTYAQTPVSISAPGTAVVETPPGAPALAPEIQIVRFHGPEGVKAEVVSPAPEAVPVGDGHGMLTVGLRVGVAYRLRLTDLPGRAGADLYPVIQIVGHLHRPEGIDASKFPIRIAFTEDDFVEAVDKGRLVTQVIYLEDPELALPVSLPKDEIPVVSVSPAEDPLKVALALGRVMALVQTGGRKPTAEELSGGGPSVLLDSGTSTPRHCPFVGTSGTPCPLACGPAVGRPPEAGRAWLPRDEFLCDGGDRGMPAHFDGTASLRGIDPRDAVIQFDDGRRPRLLPTNIVCVYAPRFSEVRMSVGPNETLLVEGPLRTQFNARPADMDLRQRPNRLIQNQGAEANRVRLRASGLAARLHVGEHEELRVLTGFDTMTHIAGHVFTAGAQNLKLRQKAGGIQERNRLEGIKITEKVVLTGIVEGAGEQVMTWPARETVGVETPPNRPGLAVIKRVSASEAEPGDTLTFVIQYRNMGNVPIRSVTVTDSLLPRLDYVPGSAQGPKGTVFTTGENKAGGAELRWELPGAIPPGGEGHVSFQATVR